MEGKGLSSPRKNVWRRHWCDDSLAWSAMVENLKVLVRSWVHGRYILFHRWMSRVTTHSVLRRTTIWTVVVPLVRYVFVRTYERPGESYVPRQIMRRNSGNNFASAEWGEWVSESLETSDWTAARNRFALSLSIMRTSVNCRLQTVRLLIVSPNVIILSRDTPLTGLNLLPDTYPHFIWPFQLHSTLSRRPEASLAPTVAFTRCTTLQTFYGRQPSFSAVAAAKIWNALPDSLVSITYVVPVLSVPSENIFVPATFLVVLQWT